MNILLVSQCSGNALKETRRVLDQFAERRGERTWQTPITQAGLETLHKLLRKTARKNTAVACHWLHAGCSELLWIVGNRARFNELGAVPTDTTTRNILRAESENDWHTLPLIRLLAQLAALLHDLGKASEAFQERLRGERSERNLYRHEWVSLRLFLAFVGTDDDDGWLTRLADGHATAADWTATDRYLRDGVDTGIDRQPFRTQVAQAPWAAAISWLIVTHHRLPVVPFKDEDGSQKWFGRRVKKFDPAWLETPLAQVAHDWNEIDPQVTPATAQPYWDLAGELPSISPIWQAKAARAAKGLLALRNQHTRNPLDDPWIMHLARLTLMLADHHYSSLKVDDKGHAVAERKRFEQPRSEKTLFANTLALNVMNQTLLEHLLGVGHTASLIGHALPGFVRHLPHLANHRGLRKRSSDPRFSWQDKAFDAACSLRESAQESGAFIVNMASTGCGKTLANVRILYALAKPQTGMRVSYALGLRTLTLQTGRSYRHDLHLGDDELAVLVGGSASRDLFEYHEQQAEAGGSASTQALLAEDSHVLYEGTIADNPLLSRACRDPDITRLLSAPMLVCTVDHLAPATESLRAGRQIAPMLRLMSSDLVLDELDDYDIADLPALTRLMHWAGMLGTRVVLSSATLPPALVEGMFLAYQAGRRHHRRNRGQQQVADDTPLGVPCLWTDEFGKPQVETCHDSAGFMAAHTRFVANRIKQLQSAPPLRIVELQPLQPPRSPREDRLRAEFAQQIRQACLRLHHDHAETDPRTGKRVSFGIVRMANIDPILEVARNLVQTALPDGIRVHLCVYHARFPLVQRSAIEAMLDATFNRRQVDAVWQQPKVRAALDRPDSEPDHLFVVLASPVCEVGRDWDADWAIAEPSSMRALIQLAGRIQRHRRQAPDRPNLLVFNTNLKGLALGHGHGVAFMRPGFEDTDDERFKLHNHDLRQLLEETEYCHISAIPRIASRAEAALRPQERWVDLEHSRIRLTMLPAPPALESTRSSRRGGPQQELQAPACWQHPQATLTGVLPQQQPFREDNQPDVKLVWLPEDEEDDTLSAHRVEESEKRRRGSPLYVEVSLDPVNLEPAAGISRWGIFDLARLVSAQADAQGLSFAKAAARFTPVQVPASTQGWTCHPWLGVGKQR